MTGSVTRMGAITTRIALENVNTMAVVGASTSTPGEVLGHDLGGLGWGCSRLSCTVWQEEDDHCHPVHHGGEH